jgi:O-antigen/teichoic acid export membrane protein
MRLAHIGWNLVGLSLPLVVAAATVPHLIDQIGNERFGLLALAWGLIGYAGALDLGIGRAVTQKVSRLRGEGVVTAIPHVLATASRITFISGLVGGVLIAIAGLSGVAGLVETKGIPIKEIRDAMLLLAIALPAQSMSATYRGVNEAYKNFKGINLLRIGLGVVTFGGPYLVALYTQKLPWLVATLVVSRLSALLIYRWLAFSCIPGKTNLDNNAVYSKIIAKDLFVFGGWVTVSSVVSPILVQSDRFFIASIISASAVSIYILPYEIVVQTLILVTAVSSVMFPTISKMLVESPDQWRRYFYRWLAISAGGMLLVCTALAYILPIVLKIWLQKNFEPQSVLVGQVLCVGVFANSIGILFYALLHAKGRSDITARLHLVELPFFLLILFFLVERYGVTGAALAWVLRMTVDAGGLAWFALRKNF